MLRVGSRRERRLPASIVRVVHDVGGVTRPESEPRATARPPETPYIESGAEIPNRLSVLASVTCVALASASRAAERSGASASTTRASR